MVLEPGVITTLALAGIAGVVWAVRTEGRVTGHDNLFVEREKQADDRFDEVKARLVRIETKIDNARWTASRRERERD